jgi:hypothetical protein
MDSPNGSRIGALARSRRTRIVGAVAVVAVAAVAAALPAGGSDAARRDELDTGRPVGDLPPMTTYGYTDGQPVQLSVPAGAQAVSFVATGGAGGTAAAQNGSAPCGKGAQVSGYALVAQGQTVTISVGQQGAYGGTGSGQGGQGGSYGGGSSGTAAGPNGPAGGGGAASTVAVSGTTVAVAGGGGGTGAWGFGSGTDGDDVAGGGGGNGGQPAGAGSHGEFYTSKGGPAGGPGAELPGTAGGTGDNGSPSKYSGGANGAGGGGGGGVNGGGGGSAGSGGTGSGGGGGGAGGSMLSSAVYGPMIKTAPSTGDGSIVVEWLSGFTIQFSPALPTQWTAGTPLTVMVTGKDFDGNPLGDVSAYIGLASGDPYDTITGNKIVINDPGPDSIIAYWIGTQAIASGSVNVVSSGS